MELYPGIKRWVTCNFGRPYLETQVGRVGRISKA